jgi:hypothetical protein
MSLFSNLDLPDVVDAHQKWCCVNADGCVGQGRSEPNLAVCLEVWSRDDGRCTWTEVDGSCCQERLSLDLDHVQMLRISPFDAIRFSSVGAMNSS